jgi:sulfotransferase family protein
VSEPQRCLILSSGRCGSTLLSNLIALEADTLSAQETLVIRNLDLWGSDDKMTGADYWDILARPRLQWEVAVRIGAIDDEVRYPATGRWGADPAALPPIARVTLPAVSDDPDALFDLLAERVPGFPAQSLALHHVMLIDLLASLRGRRRWVERTGASSAVAVPLLTRFPFDKVVYLTRDMAATAASMSRHVSFQFASIRTELSFRCGFDPYEDLVRSRSHVDEQQVPAELRCLLPERLTLETLSERGGKVEQHKLGWLHMRHVAETALAEHAPSQLLRMRYEDLIAAPEAELTRLAEFLEFADPAGWVVDAARLVRRPRDSARGAREAPRPGDHRG